MIGIAPPEALKKAWLLKMLGERGIGCPAGNMNLDSWDEEVTIG